MRRVFVRNHSFIKLLETNQVVYLLQKYKIQGQETERGNIL